MSETEGNDPSFFARFVLAYIAFFRVLFDARFAAGVMRVRRGELPSETVPASKEPPKPEPPRIQLREAAPDAALQLLSLLQREGRFVDFLQEEIKTFSDAEIGAAARVVHEGCRKAVREHFSIEPVRGEDEGASVVLDEGFDAGEVRLVGNVVGKPPFKGTLRHRGWRASSVSLPKLAEGHHVEVLAPAEVEL